MLLSFSGILCCCETSECFRGSEKPYGFQRHAQLGNIETFWIPRLHFSVSPTRPSTWDPVSSQEEARFSKRSAHAESVEESPQKNQSACLPPALQRLGQIIIMAYENFTWNSAPSETSRGCVIAPPALFTSPGKACLMPLNVLLGIKRGSPNGNLPTPVLWCYRFAHIAAAWEWRWRFRISVARGLSNPSSLY